MVRVSTTASDEHDTEMQCMANDHVTIYLYSRTGGQLKVRA